MISTIKWLPPYNYYYYCHFRCHCHCHCHCNRFYGNSLLNFEQRKKITYLGALSAIIYLIYLSSKFPQETLTWNSYVKTLLNLKNLP